MYIHMYHEIIKTHTSKHPWINISMEYLYEPVMTLLLFLLFRYIKSNIYKQKKGKKKDGENKGKEVERKNGQ